MSPLSSAPLPPPSTEDHRDGPPDRALAIVYADYECPYCAVLEERLVAIGAQRVFRHFPVKSKHPRAWAAACAAEAAGLQGRFWEMHRSLFDDQGRLEDPHLWDRAERLGLDVARFDADRRSEAVRERVARDFTSGVRAGVVTTPTLFLDGKAHPGLPNDELLALLR
ncbi:MAG TPA: DsbA family protein [Conexibacter sp.]